MAVTVDNAKIKGRYRVTEDFEKLRAAWTEAELGEINDADLKLLCGNVGEILEIEEDDDTVQLRWENLDEAWVPISVLTETSDPLSSPPPVSHLLDKPEEVKLGPAPGLTQVDGPYLTDADAAEDAGLGGKTVQVTEDLAYLRKTWDEAELGVIDDETLALYLLQTGKVMEIEEDDDTFQLRWQTYDTTYIPISACRDAKGAEETSPPSVSCLAGEPEAAEESKPVFMKKEWTLDGDTYFKDPSEVVPKKMRVMVTKDYGYLAQVFEYKGLELPGGDANIIAGYGADVVSVDNEKAIATIKFSNKKQIDVPTIALHKFNKKTKNKGAPKGL